MNLKEQYRMEVRLELKKLEITCLDIASLLRGLGIQVGTGPTPSSHEVSCILLIRVCGNMSGLGHTLSWFRLRQNQF